MKSLRNLTSLLSFVLVGLLLATTAGPAFADVGVAVVASGELTAISDTEWVIGGVPYVVDSSTVKPSFYALGDTIEVTFYTDAVLGNVATEFRLLASAPTSTYTYQGVLAGFSATEWTVDAYTFDVSGVALPPYFGAGDEVVVTFMIVGDQFVATAVQVLTTNVPAKTESSRCVNRTKEHPGALKLAARIDADAEQVEAYFCLGFGLGEVKQAYKHAEGSQYTPAMLLALRSSGMGWGQVKKEAASKPAVAALGPQNKHQNQSGNNGKGNGQDKDKPNKGKKK